jgi:hypothetical protein
LPNTLTVTTTRDNGSLRTDVSAARSGDTIVDLIEMLAQTEVLSALRADTPARVFWRRLI